MLILLFLKILIVCMLMLLILTMIIKMDKFLSFVIRHWQSHVIHIYKISLVDIVFSISLNLAFDVAKTLLSACSELCSMRNLNSFAYSIAFIHAFVFSMSFYVFFLSFSL